MSTGSKRPIDPRFACLLAFALAAGCGGDGPPPATTGGEVEVTESRQQARGEARDATAVRDYRLTMDAVRRYVEATEGFYARAAADPALQARMADWDVDQDAESLDELIRQIESVPEWRGEIERAGLSVRDYTLIMMSVTAVGVYVAFRDMGYEAERNEWISDRNITFFEQNRDEIESLMQRLQGYQDLFDDDDDPMGW